MKSLFSYGIHQYPDATHILIFCDCAGGNGYRHYAFKNKYLDFKITYDTRGIIVFSSEPEVFSLDTDDEILKEIQSMLMNKENFNELMEAIQ